MQLPLTLIIYGRQDNSQRYRCQHLAEQLSLFGLPCQLAELRSVSLTTLAQQSLVIFHRVPFDKFLDHAIRQLRLTDTITLFDTDDLIFAEDLLPFVRSLQNASPLQQRLFAAEVRGYRQLMERVQGVLVTTNYLSEQAQLINPTVIVHRNAFSLALWQASALASKTGIVTQSRQSLILGYASGTATHNEDFRQIQPMLRQTLKENSQIELHLIGPLEIREEWGAVAPRVRQFPLVNWRALPGQLARFDINLAPLESANPFCQAKSEIKFVEAALVGKPTIASRTEAFEFAMQAGENGWLANSSAEWQAALVQAINEPERRDAYAANAKAKVTERYHPVTRGFEFLQALNQLSFRLQGCAFIAPDYLHTCYEKLRLALPTSPVEQMEAEQMEIAPPTALAKALYAIRYRNPVTIGNQALLVLQQHLQRWRLRAR